VTVAIVTELAPDPELTPTADEAATLWSFLDFYRSILIRKDAIEALRQHRCPGNFRELEIAVERALMLYGDGEQVTAADVHKALAEAT